MAIKLAYPLGGVILYPSFFFFFLNFFLMWIILKVFIEFDTILSLFYVLVFWPRGMWDLNSLASDGTHTRALEGEVLTSGLPFLMASSTASVRRRGSRE